jgi:hypothetical protein
MASKQEKHGKSDVGLRTAPTAGRGVSACPIFCKKVAHISFVFGTWTQFTRKLSQVETSMYAKTTFRARPVRGGHVNESVVPPRRLFELVKEGRWRWKNGKMKAKNIGFLIFEGGKRPKIGKNQVKIKVNFGGIYLIRFFRFRPHTKLYGLSGLPEAINSN